ncbi:MAG: hypothetical protein IJS44_05300 [Clostridia bacterium]|nr:hypothetical protein [Clostridia bacterium]
MKKVQPLCENCEYYDYDEEYDGYVCTQSFDQDEAGDLMHTGYTVCPYFKFYDEYKSVQKQN